jgi:hypothetical protein
LTSARAMSSWPLRTANINAVSPPVGWSGMLALLEAGHACEAVRIGSGRQAAPRRSSACPSEAAHISAVCSWNLSAALTSAPASTRSLTASRCAGARRPHQRRVRRPGE